MYRWILYQAEEVVLLAIDACSWCLDHFLYLPWRWMSLAAICLLFVYLLSL